MLELRLQNRIHFIQSIINLAHCLAVCTIYMACMCMYSHNGFASVISSEIDGGVLFYSFVPCCISQTKWLIYKKSWSMHFVFALSHKYSIRSNEHTADASERLAHKRLKNYKMRVQQFSTYNLAIITYRSLLSNRNDMLCLHSCQIK